jgi:ankyrin repeat protein
METTDINLVDVQCMSAIATAAASGCNTVLKLLLSVPGVGPNHRDCYGRTAIYWAAAWGHAVTIEYLVDEMKADISIADDCGRTPLMVATKTGRREVVDLLQSHCGTDVPESEMQAGLTRLLSQDVVLRCDICQVNIFSTEFSYNCDICASGNYDLCIECQGHGMTCMDKAHVLIKRIMQDDAWVKVDKGASCS